MSEEIKDMDALEKIKEIESIYLDAKEDGYDYEMGGDYLGYLLRAFNVMKMVAERYKQDLDVRADSDGLRIPTWKYVESSVDEEFEKRMLKELPNLNK